jgi:tetratricopeptide (TPR) repeat protein
MSRVVAVVTEDSNLQNRVKLICQGVNPPLTPRFYSDYDKCLVVCEAAEGSDFVAVVFDQSVGRENVQADDSKSAHHSVQQSVHQSALFCQRLRAMGGHRFTPLIVIDSPITPTHLARGSEYTFFRIVDKSGHESVLQSALNALAAELARPNALRQSLHRVASAWQNGQEGEVEHILEECYQTFNDDEEVLVEYGSLCLKKGRLEKAERVFAKLVNRPSQSLRIANFLARVELKNGNVTGALSILDRANLLSPGNLDRLVLMGDAFRSQGSLTDAEEKYEEALELDSSHGDAKKGIGLIALSQGETDRAIEFFRGTCSEEETVGFFNNTAVLAVKRAQFEQAEQLYNAAIGVVAGSKTRAKVHFNLGLMYRRWSRPSDAAESFRTALSLDSSFEKAERHLNATSAGLAEIAAVGAQQNSGFDSSDETFIGSVSSPANEPEALSALRKSVDFAMTEENLSDAAPPLTGPKVKTGPKEQGSGTSLKSPQGGTVRTVDLPGKDVKPFAAEQLGGSAGGQKSQSQTSKAPGASPGNKTQAKPAPKFIDDEAGDGADGGDSSSSVKGPKKAG